METAQILEALERIQALISADVKSPWCPGLVNEELGKAYYDFAKALARQAWEVHLDSNEK